VSHVYALLARLGRVHATLAVLTFYLALFGGGLLIDRSGYFIACVFAYALYCGARPHNRWEVFFLAFAPGAGAGILDKFFDVPAVWGLVVLLFVLRATLIIDRRTIEPADAPEADRLPTGLASAYDRRAPEPEPL
jgi:hypothetical protein